MRNPNSSLRGKLVGFGNRTQVGKKSAARGTFFVELSFAANVRAKAEFIDSYVSDFGLRLTDAAERLGPDGEKLEVDEVRRLIQELGGKSEELIGSKVWIQPTIEMSRILRRDGSSVAIPDVRFPDEADAIKSAGGIVVRIDRPDVPRLDHPTECALDDYDFDHVIDNSGTVEELCAAVRAIVGHGS